ncbi:hypothetical protein HD554DRAFT_2172214 [Boletus coccyginus]|nr:hypothetical protein HD554DRAFT_2172214 [Boletus coccyginus]
MSVPHPQPQLHDQSQPPPAPGTASGIPGFLGPGSPSQDQGSPQRRTAFNSERPLAVSPVSEGGVAIGGQPGLSEGHASIGDKIVGKTQKVIGKYTHNPELHEKGELRETGGKAAAEGRARAAHD